MRITDQANEATDNVRYLGALESACKPLYACDPTAMAEHIPNLIKLRFKTTQILNIISWQNFIEIIFI